MHEDCHWLRSRRVSAQVAVKDKLLKEGFEVVDFGTDSVESVDWPKLWKSWFESSRRWRGRKGIVICGSGIGISIAANKSQRR